MKLLHYFYCRVVHASKPVIDAATGRKEIATHTELFGFVVKTTYKPL